MSTPYVTLGISYLMRIGRIVALTAGAALAVFGVMHIKRSRSSDVDDPASGESPLDLTVAPPSSNADQSRLTSTLAE